MGVVEDYDFFWLWRAAGGGGEVEELVHANDAGVAGTANTGGGGGGGSSRMNQDLLIQTYLVQLVDQV